MNCTEILKMVNYHDSFNGCKFLLNSGFTYRMLETPRDSEMSMKIHCLLHYKILVKAVVTLDP